MRNAVFLDRDGVINEMVQSDKTNEYEPPHNPSDLKIYHEVIDELKLLLNNEFMLFLISNQPDAAKGKTNIENLKAVHEKLHKYFSDNDIFFTEYYYCYHHPDGIVPEYSFECECRKPKPYFILKAVKDYSINQEFSWIIGDRDMDIKCGAAAGINTILVKNIYSKNYTGKVKPDFSVDSLREAIGIVLKNKWISKQNKGNLVRNDKIV